MFITKTRITLIQIGKVLPFVVCFIVFLSYIEDVYALSFCDYIEFSDGVYLKKPLSWSIGEYFKYDIITLSILVVLSIAIETCVYNKLACGYLGINLAEKSYFDFELEPTTIYIICLANILVAGYLTIKGIKILTRHE
jgi:hypothetical protein